MAFRHIYSAIMSVHIVKPVVKICGSSYNLYAFVVYRNSVLSGKILNCLLTALAKVQSVDRKFVGDVNHEEWLASSTMNLHGKAARDFASSPGCEQMVTEPKQQMEGCLT